jgi:hypothetical protein
MSHKPADRFADLARLRLDGCRALTLADERGLLTVGVVDLGLDLDDARGILLRLAADNRVLLESVERERVAMALREVARNRRVDRSAWREAALLARPWAQANGGDGSAARQWTREVAAGDGITPVWRWWWLGPRRWYEADPAWLPVPATSPVPWQAAR